MISIAENFRRELENEHRESFINSPGLNQVIEGALPLDKQQLKKKLYTSRHTFNKGKKLEYYIDGEDVLDIEVNCNNTQKIFTVEKSLDFFATLTKAVSWFISQSRSQKDLVKLNELQIEFRDSNFSYEEGCTLQNFLENQED